MFVAVKQGRLEGSKKISVLTGKEYYAFLGIPYAKPPVGDLRFQAPQPIDKWDGTLDGTKEGSPCIQKFFTSEYFGSEDCLYLNVFTPSPPSRSTTPKAVMVFIHGGAYIHGSGSIEYYSPDYLIDYDVVIVTLNYRLHVLGFLNMGTPNQVANCGLRDQWLALKWINENVAEFGGDPRNITIFGESAGGSSVHCHMISPQSKGLFQKAIIQSDAAFVDIRRKNDPRQAGLALAQKLGCTETDPEKVVEFLKKQSVENLAEGSNFMFEKFMKQRCDGNLADVFVPTPEIGTKNAFLPDTICNLMKTATPIPLIVGQNNKEGALEFLLYDGDILKMLKTDFTSTIHSDIARKVTPLKLRDMSEKLKTFYLQDKPVGGETVNKIVDLFTGRYFQNFYESFDFIAHSDVPVYVYEFSLSGKFKLFKEIEKKYGLEKGANHADELPYLFYGPKFFSDFQEFVESEKTVIRNLCSLWTNFAKTGNPTKNFTDIEWKAFTPEKPCYLQINRDLRMVEGKIREKEFEFWQALYKQAVIN